MGNWFAKRPGARQKLVLATKLAGPARGMDWIRHGSAPIVTNFVLSLMASAMNSQP